MNYYTALSLIFNTTGSSYANISDYFELISPGLSGTYGIRDQHITRANDITAQREFQIQVLYTYKSIKLQTMDYLYLKSLLRIIYDIL